MISSDKEHIYLLAKTAKEKGIKHIIFSPGSRSAPLVIAFNRQPGIQCYVIPDERCAAFIALGMAQQSDELVGLVCTSGSAVLNYAPAISEAYYQKIPLLVMTADRPNEAIDQGENQSIYQFDIYKNYIKKSVELPVDTNDERDQWYSLRLFNEAINTAHTFPKGPVHVNIPLREPLYQTREYKPSDAIDSIATIPIVPNIATNDYKNLTDSWQGFTKKLIILGNLKPNPTLTKQLETLATRQDIVLFSENISNQHSPLFVQNIDALVEFIEAQKQSNLTPELVVTVGGGLISKKLKFWLRKAGIHEHWHLSESNEHWDNFHALKKIIPLKPTTFFNHIIGHTQESNSIFNQDYNTLKQSIHTFHQSYLNTLPYCDFKVFDYALNNLPTACNLFFGNSTPIRYSNLISLPSSLNQEIYANRGVSGIDGIVSTAIGGSMIRPDRLHICFVGDISFFYDSNGWWNNYLKPNFKCVLINNQGGNIFKIIPGPDQLEEVETFFETAHHLNGKPIADLYQVDYFEANNMEELQCNWPRFIATSSNKPAILEIKTPASGSECLRNYFKEIKSLNI